MVRRDVRLLNVPNPLAGFGMAKEGRERERDKREERKSERERERERERWVVVTRTAELPFSALTFPPPFYSPNPNAIN